MIQPKTVILMHYNTLEQIHADEYKRLVETSTKAEVKILQAGDILDI